MSWPDESSRHSLASRGIRTRAIPNMVADPKWNTRRKYIGSGLENIDVDRVMKWISGFMELFYEINGPQKYPLVIERVYLVGSRVTGHYNPGKSDLDVVVSFKKNKISDDEDYIDEFQSIMLDTMVEMKVELDRAYIVDDNNQWIPIEIARFGFEIKPLDDRAYLEIWEAS